MADPLVVRVMRERKAALLAKEAGQMAEMARRWLSVERTLEGQMAALAQEMIAENLQGRVTQSKLFRMGRYQELMRQLQTEMGRYSAYSVQRITQGQREWGRYGVGDAQQGIVASYVRSAPEFMRLPREAVEYMAGLTGNGSPLNGLLSLAYGDAAQGITDALIKGTALGWNPRKTAAAMRNGLAHGLGRELTIARTEQIRVYREASVAQYEASGVVEGMTRLVAHDDRTCLACLAREGEMLKLGEQLEDHPNGRCSLIPLVSGARAPQFEKGAAWYARQSPDVQEKMMGADRYAAWRGGKFEFEQLARSVQNDTWGNSVRVATLDELVKAA